MKNILLIHTGGTIAMTENANTGSVSTTNSHPLASEDAIIKQFAKVNDDYLFDLPSPHITPVHMLKLGQHIERNLKTNTYDGIVITHGTDTLEETAYFLDLYLETNKPIVITGAMRSSNEIGSDGLYNLISAIRVASAEESEEKGVLVVMNDEIHTAAYATKTSTSNIATFKSPQFGPIGMLTKQTVYFYHKSISFETYKVESITKQVPLIKAYAGMDQTLFNAVTSISLDGIVIEGFGQGNLPPAIVDSIEQLIKKSIPVVLVSRSFKGIVQPTYDYPGGGKQLKNAGVLFAKGLTGQKARIKLLLLLESNCSLDRLETIFEAK
ncbi:MULTISPECIES: asparaginase [Paraliobacillus]|uniref:asparaginase n=1 Tax=Paraliobacillus TaxID=200903 RepID=UPI000DD3DAE4|nr:MULTISPECIES: asparaginase [Paraliobacillus]